MIYFGQILLKTNIQFCTATVPLQERSLKGCNLATLTSHKHVNLKIMLQATH